MAGGGVIIIRNAIKQALSDPLVSGALPSRLQAAIAAPMGKDVNDWDDCDDRDTQRAFNWAMTNLTA